MRALRTILFSIAAVAACSMAAAGDRIAIGFKAGTYGAGIDLTGRIIDWFSLRGTVNAVNTSRSYAETDVNYDADVRVGGYGLIADFHPLMGNFRISAGLLRNRNAIDLTAVPTQDVTIGNNTYPPALVGELDGAIRFKKNTPYIGIGYGSAAKSGLPVKFLLDVGVVQQGAGTASIVSSSGLVAPSDLRAEEAKIEDQIKSYKLWPVIALGLSIRL
jgi:hypothetical protein